jgi:hypothetical protein
MPGLGANEGFILLIWVEMAHYSIFIVCYVTCIPGSANFVYSDTVTNTLS